MGVVGNRQYTSRAANFLKEYTNQISLLWYKDDNPPSIEGVSTYASVDSLEAYGDDRSNLGGVKFKTSNGNHTLDLAVLFVEGTPEPASSIFKNTKLELDNGYIKVNDSYATNVANIWAIGEVAKGESGYDVAVRSGEELAKIIGKK